MSKGWRWWGGEWLNPSGLLEREKQELEMSPPPLQPQDSSVTNLRVVTNPTISSDLGSDKFLGHQNHRPQFLVKDWD